MQVYPLSSRFLDSAPGRDHTDRANPVEERRFSAAKSAQKGTRLQPLKDAALITFVSTTMRIYFLTAFLEPRRDSWTNRSTSPSRRPRSSARWRP